MNAKKTLLAETVIEALRRVLPGDGFKALHEPCFSKNEWQYVKDCIDTGWVSSVGSYVDRFESDISDYTGASHAVAVVNGTAALQLALEMANVRAGDEVVMPTLTFVATANATAYLGAVPHFADTEKKTLGIDPFKLESYLSSIAEVRDEDCFNVKTGRRIGAVVPMHTFGHPVDLAPLTDCCSRFRIPMVEDAAESIGSLYRGRHTGTFGVVGVFSFNGNKTITTGGGGALVMNDPEMARLAKHVSTTAKIPHPWEYRHDSIGYNYRMPNINAALGCAQLEQLPEFLKRKRRLAQRYAAVIDPLEEISFFCEPHGCKSNYWLNTVLLDCEDRDIRDSILEKTNAAGIMTRPVWTPLHRLSMFAGCPQMDLSVAERLENSIINLPSGPGLYG